MKTLSRHKAIVFVAFFLFAISVNSSRGQRVMISVSGPPDTTGQYNGRLGVNQTLKGISWVESDAYTNVNVSVALGADAGATGEAYLTEYVGPGTGPNYQVASTGFAFPSTSSSVSVFSGLNLAAGTYYLVIQQTASGGSGTAFWLGTASPDLVTATDVSANGDYESDDAIQSYPPATPFSESFPADFDFSVTGAAVPEPSAICLFALGGGIGILGFRKKRV